MFKRLNFKFPESAIISSVFLLIVISNFVLHSISKNLFPGYYLYVVTALIIFYIFLKIDFEVLLAFSKHLYFLGILFLIITLIIGQVTRGSIRWIPLGSIAFQPSEIFRSFILLYIAKYATEKEINAKRFFKLIIYVVIPFLLILIQPSLGVALITGVGFLGIILATSIDKKLLIYGFMILIFTIPFSWFLLEPYQQQRVRTFLNPYNDPLGAGYNSIQSTISVGSGKIFGRGLGQGIQTQLAYLPEKHTDFIFAAISEELGFLGASLTLISFLVIFLFMVKIIDNPRNITARVFVSGVFFIFLSQTFIHIGMNMGIVPITGLPLPFVSAGGSALVGSFILMAIAIKAKK